MTRTADLLRLPNYAEAMARIKAEERRLASEADALFAKSAAECQRVDRAIKLWIGVALIAAGAFVATWICS